MGNLHDFIETCKGILDGSGGGNQGGRTAPHAAGIPCQGNYQSAWLGEDEDKSVSYTAMTSKGKRV